MKPLNRFGRPQTQVLVVEDSAFNRTLLGQMVSKMGFEVEFAKNGREGVEKVKQLQPDIVLMDIHMPEMDGIQAARAIKNLKDIPHTPIMFVSSGIEPEELRSAIEAGGDDYVQRPFLFELLEAKVIAHLRTADLYRQVAAFSEARAREEEMAESLFSNAVEYGNLNDASITVVKRPADLFSGDVQLTARRPNGDINILLGDFTGHGLSASIGALPLSETFRSMTLKGYEGSAILKQINSKMYRLLPTHMFLAATMVTLTQERVATVWNLGLPDAYILNGDELQKRIPSSAPPLGILRELTELPSERVQLDDQHQLLLVSDGVLEANDLTQQLFGETRMLDALKRGEGSVVDRVLQAVDQFTEGEAQSDDISLICISGGARHNEESAVLALDEISAPQPHTIVVADDVWSWELELSGRSLARIDPVAQAIGRLTEAEGDRKEWQTVFTILTELFVNALDHGVLGLDSSIKTGSQGFDRYYAERDKRLEDLSEGSVKIGLRHVRLETGGLLIIQVENSGAGFDFARVAQEQANNAGRLSGRGIKLIKTLAQRVDYFNGGRTAEVEFSYG